MAAFEKLHERLWIFRDTLPGKQMPRNMVVYKTDSGDLVLHSVVALNETHRRELESFGRVRWMIVPSGLHRLDAPKYKALYPSIEVLAPSGARKKIEERVKVDANVEDVTVPGMKALSLDGLKDQEFCYDFDLGAGRALVFNDALMNIPDLTGVEGWILKTLGSTGFFGTTRIGRLLMMKDRSVWKSWLERQAARIDLRLVTVSHGEPITSDVGRKLRAAADRL